jgi:hypothetical protein
LDGDGISAPGTGEQFEPYFRDPDAGWDRVELRKSGIADLCARYHTLRADIMVSSVRLSPINAAEIC